MSDEAGEPVRLGDRLAQTLIAALAAALTILAVGWSLNVPRMMSLALYPQQFFAVVLGLALALTFLKIRARKSPPGRGVPWYDWAAASLAFGACGFVALVYPDVVPRVFLRPGEATIPGTIIVLLLLEALRRVTGPALAVIVSVFLLYAVFGDVFSGRLAARAQDWPKLAGYMAYDSNGLLGIPIAIASTIVVAFIFFGTLLNVTGGAKFFTDAALILMGRFRGGSMKIAVLASALFGSISGSAVANVAATGVVTIAMIKRDGYPAHRAGAIEAVSSTGGQLMPPVMGASAFLMAEFLQVPYADVVLAALVPALLYYGALFVQADLEAARLGISRTPESEIPSRNVILGGLHFTGAFALLIYALFGMAWQPERAALLACVSVAAGALVFGYDGTRVKIRTLLLAFVKTGESVIEIIVICAAAGVVIGVLNVTGLSFNLTYTLVQIGAQSAILLLVLSALVCIVLGMGLPTLGVYVLLATLVAPALVEMGIHPLAAHLFVLYFGMMSMITPPIALAAFAAASIAQAGAMRTGVASVRFGWLAFIVPFLFVFSPTLILIGGPGEIAMAVVTAAFGVWLVSASLAGYFVERLSAGSRILFALAGLAALVPSATFAGAAYTDMFGLVAGMMLMIFELVRLRAGKTAGAGK